MPEKQHIHIIARKTSSDLEHLHFFSGISGPAYGEGLAHTHRIQVSTAVFQGHDHMIDVETETGIATGAGHVHVLRGITGVNGEVPHTHRFNDLTGPSMLMR